MILSIGGLLVLPSSPRLPEFASGGTGAGVNASLALQPPIVSRALKVRADFLLTPRLRLEPDPLWRRLANVANPPALPSMGLEMSLLLPISFVVTLLCVLFAIDWAFYQQILFVGAALSATVMVCSLEAWSCQEAPVRSEDQRSHHYPANDEF